MCALNAGIVAPAAAVLAAGWGLLAVPGVVQLGIACLVGPGSGDTRTFLATWGVVISASPLLGLAGGLLMGFRRRAGAVVVLLGAVLGLNVLVLYHSERQAMVSLLAVMPALARPYLQYLGAGVLLHLAAAVGFLWPAAGRAGRP
ncbi:MAG TPA: hypothetical protein VF282_07680 [Bacillota bacterium]